MTSEQAVYDVLRVYPGLISLVGSRIYSVQGGQGEPLPFLVFQLIANAPENTHGVGAGDSRIDGNLFQVTALGVSQLVCANVLLQARLALEAANSLACVMVDERASAKDESAQCHVRSADFQVWHDPTT